MCNNSETCPCLTQDDDRCLRLVRQNISGVIVLSSFFSAFACPAYASSPTDCLTQVRKSLEDSTAFKITCSAKFDCEFESSIGGNASAIAAINAIAIKLKSCWGQAGLKNQIKIDTPVSMKTLVHRYTALPSVQNSVICTMAEFKPYAASASSSLTTAFRAQCKTK
jgi:hypothetical protein